MKKKRTHTTISTYLLRLPKDVAIQFFDLNGHFVTKLDPIHRDDLWQQSLSLYRLNQNHPTKPKKKKRRIKNVGYNESFCVLNRPTHPTMSRHQPQLT